MSPAERIAWTLRLPPAKAAILAFLHERGEKGATAEELFKAACPFSRGEEYKALHVHMVALRRIVRERCGGEVRTTYPDGVRFRKVQGGGSKAGSYVLDAKARAWLRAALEAEPERVAGIPVRPEWRLTPMETRVFERLAARPCITAADVTEVSQTRSLTSARVIICKLRQKLGYFGLEIEGVFGRGYRLADASRAKLAAAGPVR